MVGVDIYPLPGDKVDVNNGIGKQLSMGLIGAADAWPAATPAERAKIWQAHKDYALELLWFLGHDPASMGIRHRPVDPAAHARFAEAIRKLKPEER